MVLLGFLVNMAIWLINGFFNGGVLLRQLIGSYILRWLKQWMKGMVCTYFSLCEYEGYDSDPGYNY